MQIFLDTSRPSEIQTWLAQGVIDGVTTNPSILLKDGNLDLAVGVRTIAKLIAPRPLSVEVFSSDRAEVLRQAREFAGWAENIVVKVTVIDEHGKPNFDVIRQLESEGIRVNCTACMSFGQVMLAAKAGASYISIFVGRINDEGHDGPGVVRMAREWLDAWGYSSQLIAGSIRGAIDVQQVALAGAHAITIPPEQMAKLADHHYTRATVEQFLADGRQAFGASDIERLLRAA